VRRIAGRSGRKPRWRRGAGNLASVTETISHDPAISANLASVTQTISHDSTISANLASVTQTISHDPAISANLASVTETISRDPAIFANLASVTQTISHDPTISANLASVTETISHDPAIFANLASITETISRDSTRFSSRSKQKTGSAAAGFAQSLREYAQLVHPRKSAGHLALSAVDSDFIVHHVCKRVDADRLRVTRHRREAIDPCRAVPILNLIPSQLEAARRVQVDPAESFGFAEVDFHPLRHRRNSARPAVEVRRRDFVVYFRGRIPVRRIRSGRGSRAADRQMRRPGVPSDLSRAAHPLWMKISLLNIEINCLWLLLLESMRPIAVHAHPTFHEWHSQFAR